MSTDVSPPLVACEGGTKPEKSAGDAYTIPEPQSPTKVEDVELIDNDNVFLTEAGLRDIGTIDEVFEDDDILAADSRQEDAYDDADGRDSPDDSRSGVSSMSEIDEQDLDYDTDLDIEEEKWLNPDLYDRDTTGVNRYLRMCEKLEIQPITYFLKHMQDKELVMKYHGIGPLGVKAMSDPLEINTTIERMDLEGNFILGGGTVSLCKVLKDNVYITELVEDGGETEVKQRKTLLQRIRACFTCCVKSKTQD